MQCVFSLLLTVALVHALHLTALSCCNGRTYYIGVLLGTDLASALDEGVTLTLCCAHIEPPHTISMLR
jgi:hypothetical protein